MKNSLLLLVFCLACFLNQASGQCSPDNTPPVAKCKGTGDLEKDIEILDAPGLVTGNYGWGQSFTAGKTGQLEAVKFKTWVEYGPTDAIFTVKIVSGADPAGGMVLATKDLAVTNDNNTEYLVEFPMPPSITAGNQYCIVVSDNGINPGASLCRIKPEAYAGGTYYVEITPGQFFNIASVDLGFTTYVRTDASPFEVELGPGGTVNISGGDLNNNSTDNCAITSYMASPTSFGCSDIGTASATLTVMDAAGNSSSCVASVTVSDPNNNCCEYNNSMPPVANCKGGGSEKDIEILDALGLVTGNYGWGQSFTAGKTGQLEALKFKTWVEYGPTDAIFTVKIVSGANPAGGMVLATKDLAVTNDDNTEYLVEFPMPPSITAGNQYCIVVSDNGINPGASLCRIKPEAYAGGTYYVEINPGQFFNIASVDLGFTTYVSTGGSLALEIPPGGSVSVAGTDLDNNSTDNCGIASYVAFPSSFDCSDIGMTSATLTVTDYAGNSSTCVASITISDPNSNCCQGPVASCNSYVIELDNNGNGMLLVDDIAASSSADCGLMSEMVSPNSFDCMDVGPNTVTYTITDVNGAASSCTSVVTVEDYIEPTPVCVNTTIQINGETDVALNGADLWDDMASLDNCGTVSLFDISPASINCADIGSMISVTVQVVDANGNVGDCTAHITVEGLPCGWSSSPDGIGCPGGSQASFDPNASSFMVSSDGCYNPAYYSPIDAYAFAGMELCGDGEIVAQVTDVNGSGFAGIMMRNDLSANASMIRLGIDGVALTRRGMRISPGAPAFNHQFQTQGKNWLRLTRAGNQFTAMHSTDGVNWSVVITVPIPMGNCIQVGLYAESNTPNNPAVGNFENVEIKPSLFPLVTPNLPGVDIAETPEYDLESMVSVYPNPATDEAWIDLGNMLDRSATIEVFNGTGQLVQSIPTTALTGHPIKLNTNHWDNGIYMVRVQLGEGQVVTKRLVKQE